MRKNECQEDPNVQASTQKLNRDDTHGRSRSEAARAPGSSPSIRGNPDVSENGGYTMVYLHFTLQKMVCSNREDDDLL